MEEKRFEVQKDCFAYREINGKDKCAVLKGVYCKYEKCKFYKHWKDKNVPVLE